MQPPPTSALRETLLVFLADNGGPSGVNSKQGNNFPLRGGKHTDFEVVTASESRPA